MECNLSQTDRGIRVVLGQEKYQAPGDTTLMRMAFLALLLFVGAQSICEAEDVFPVFEVKGTAINSVLYDGRTHQDKGGDQVVYQVDISNKTIKRTAVYNAGIKDKMFGGIQADDSVYRIVQDNTDHGQRVIKAFGQVGYTDGWEILVIGDDFITTCKSTSDYFVLYRYKRTDMNVRSSR